MEPSDLMDHDVMVMTEWRDGTTTERACLGFRAKLQEHLRFPYW